MKILHPTDFSDCAQAAEEFAVRLLRDTGGELVLLHVLVEPPLYSETPLSLGESRRFYDAVRRWAEQALGARAATLGRWGVAVRVMLRDGRPFQEIVAAADAEGADLIAMGTHGRGGLNRLLLGSVADRVIRTAPCPVLTVRGPAAAGA